MLSLDDTIAAISTPIGEGGIGIIRCSGPAARSILERLFKRRSGQPTSGMLESHRLYYGHVVDPVTGTTVDEVLAVWMQAPHTFTRQDIVEFQGHGGMVVLRRALELVLRSGARQAGPGEFTLRAFVNGRIDLTQAEAVLDIIRAKTNAGLSMALQQLEGRASSAVSRVRSGLLNVLAHIEASIDFPEDEIPALDVDKALSRSRASLGDLLNEAQRGMIYREGVRTAIVGRPNVGKSSLLNALLRADRAIVTPIPGTTRDTLEETLNLRGVPLCLTDTAGISRTAGVVESLGMERSRIALAQADLVLLVIDGSQPLGPEDWEIAELVGNARAIVVVNKRDLGVVVDHEQLLPGVPHLMVSALTGQGLLELEDAMADLAAGGPVEGIDLPALSHPRHLAKLHEAADRVDAAIAASRSGVTSDLVAVDVAAAVQALGEVTGETIGEQVLHTIFETFCVGK